MFCDRKSYNVLIKILNNSSKKDVLETIRKKHPLPVDEKDIRLFRNGRQRVCIIFDKSERWRKKSIPTVHSMRKLRGYTGKTLFVQEKSLDFCSYEKGILIESKYKENTSDNLSELAAESRVVFLPSNNDFGVVKKEGVRLIRYPGDRKAEIIDKSGKWMAAIASVVMVVSLVLLFSLRMKAKAEAHEKFRKERAAAERIEQEKRVMSEAVAEIRKKYETEIGKIPWDAYTLMSLLSECLGGSAQLKSILINGNDFSAELEGGDFAGTLLRFEKSNEFSSCRISRMSSESGGRDGEFILSGKASPRQAESLDEMENDGEKYARYEKLLEELGMNTFSHKTLSQACDKIIEHSEALRCAVEFIQTYDEEIIKIEASFTGSRGASLALMEKLCHEFSVSELRAYILEGGRLRTVYKIDTGIRGAEKDGRSRGHRVSPEIIAADFQFKPAVSRGVFEAQSQSSAPQTVNMLETIKNSALAFLGKGESGGETLVFLKDKGSGKIIKSSNYKQKGTSIEVEIDGKIYEVQM